MLRRYANKLINTRLQKKIVAGQISIEQAEFNNINRATTLQPNRATQKRHTPNAQKIASLL